MSNFINDTFTGSSGTNLTAHTPDVGGAYSKSSGQTGDLQLTGNGTCRIASLSTDADYTNATTPPSANYVVSAAILPKTVPVGNSYPGLIARSDGAGNFYKLQFNYNAGSPGLFLYKYASGSPTLLGSYSGFTPTPTVSFTLSLTVSGTTISAAINGTTQISVTDSDISAAGLVGLVHYCDNSSDVGDSVGIQFGTFVANGAGGGGATAFTLTGPSAGPAAAASSEFTVTPNGSTSGTFTPNAISGVTFTPTTLTLSGTTPMTFTVTKSAAGTVNINGTTSDSLTPPADVSYEAKTTVTQNYVVTGNSDFHSTTVGYAIKNNDGTYFSDRTTSGVVNQGLGVYSVVASIPIDAAGIIVWDDNEIIYASEPLSSGPSDDEIAAAVWAYGNRTLTG